MVWYVPPRALLLALLLAAGAHAEFQMSRATTVKYRATAVQFTKPASLGTAARNIAQVLARFWELANQSSLAGSELVVFPEASIWGYGDYRSRESMREYCEEIPEPTGQEEVTWLPTMCSRANPSSQQGDIGQLHHLACIAMRFNLTVVANMGDVQRCTSCPDGHLQYNTEVAFGPDGRLLAKYHKSHIYGTSPGFDQPARADPVYFDAHFGVRFGLVVCYDIDFQFPTDKLIRHDKVFDFILSTSWGNIPPLNTALLTQQGWARRYGVNVIAANNGATPMNSGGGILGAGGELVSVSFHSSQFNVTELLTGDLETIPHPLYSPKHSNFLPELNSSSDMLALPPEIESFGQQEPCTVMIGAWQQASCFFLDLSSGVSIKNGLSATHNGLTCAAQLKVERTEPGSINTTTYALIALNTTLSFEHTPDPLGLEVCALVQCTSPTACKPSFQAHAVLSEWQLQGNFRRDTLLLPMVGMEDAQPVPPDLTGFSPHAGMLWSQNSPTANHATNRTLWGAILYGLAHTANTA
eukprot:TRINITY_DN24049_c0_g1_i1.p1 TRINITY_DN24049_c0_g1~~TRINITY_DN24049_c0_g1_i1.p1  ORF type:complete len:526 (-),score=86.12 TRINITY_DN24049_c0_g1_i1:256-1833(-)